jgi:DNA-directed RNA polymerase subunit RPC12/RpoP
MPSSQSVSMRSMLALPSCPKCGTRMLLIRLIPYDHGSDQRTYECHQCGHEVTEVIRFKLAS